mmetsp:Transcript_37395/g.95544  ORF Transcript_37395/g.95544 Transcript_37395/m.95544 type:complete len:301 (-) Transcript_37395:68-970(-)
MQAKSLSACPRQSSGKFQPHPPLGPRLGESRNRLRFGYARFFSMSKPAKSGCQTEYMSTPFEQRFHRSLTPTPSLSSWRVKGALPHASISFLVKAWRCWGTLNDIARLLREGAVECADAADPQWMVFGCQQKTDPASPGRGRMLWYGKLKVCGARCCLCSGSEKRASHSLGTTYMHPLSRSVSTVGTHTLRMLEDPSARWHVSKPWSRWGCPKFPPTLSPAGPSAGLSSAQPYTEASSSTSSPGSPRRGERTSKSPSSILHGSSYMKTKTGGQPSSLSRCMVAATSLIRTPRASQSTPSK